MDDYDRLLALTSAAESCNGAARTFIDRFGVEPQFSRFLSHPDQPLCEPTASMQAKQRMESAQSHVHKLERYVHEWTDAVAALSYISSAIGAALPVIELSDGTTHHTAHEAACNFAELVINTFRETEGDTDVEACFDLARRLAGLRPAPDFYGRIQAESSEAQKHVDHSPPDADSMPNTDGLIYTGRIATLAGVVRDTVTNRLSKTPENERPLPVRRGIGRAESIYKYSEVRPWAISCWPARAQYFPESFEDSEKILPGQSE